MRVVLLAGKGRGFCAGVDIKELARDGSLIVDVNRGCYDSFAAVYDCPVPVIAAVHGFCLGGGIGLVGVVRHHHRLRRTPPSACPRSTAARWARRRT